MVNGQENFVSALKDNSGAFGLDLNDAQIDALAVYSQIVSVWNKRLHLIAPCPPVEFAVRHVLESLCLLKHLPLETRLADIGTGAGLPSFPCLIVREDLRGNLIESAVKKVVYLREAAAQLNIYERATVLNVRFEHTPPPEYGVVTCRALDKFTEKLPEIIEWGKNAEKTVLFGGEKISAELERLRVEFEPQLIPLSEQRFIFVVTNKNYQAVQPNLSGLTAS